MEPNQDPSILSSQPIGPAKKSTLKKILRAVFELTVIYIIVGSILIAIDPLFGFLVLAPIFMISSFIGQFQNIQFENKVENLPSSSVTVPEKLTKSECLGLSDTPGRADNTYPGIDKYAQLLKATSLNFIGVCNTELGIFVFNSTYKNYGDSPVTTVYMDVNGNLNEIFEIPDVIFEVAEDSQKKVFLLVPKYLEQKNGFTRYALVYDSDANSFIKVSNPESDFTVCNKDNSTKCTTWRFNDVGISSGYEFKESNDVDEKKPDQSLSTDPYYKGQVSVNEAIASGLIVSAEQCFSFIDKMKLQSTSVSQMNIYCIDSVRDLAFKDKISSSRQTYTICGKDYSVQRISPVNNFDLVQKFAYLTIGQSYQKPVCDDFYKLFNGKTIGLDLRNQQGDHYLTMYDMYDERYAQQIEVPNVTVSFNWSIDSVYYYPSTLESGNATYIGSIK